MPKVQMTEKLVSAVNTYLGEEFIPSLDDAVRKYAGKDEDVSKYLRPAVINSGETGDGEVNFTLCARTIEDEAWYYIRHNYAWRYFDVNSNVSTFYGSRYRSLYPMDNVKPKQKESFNIDDPAKSKMLIAALFGTWEVEPEYLTGHTQEIDALRGQIFENWQSGVSSIDEYFMKE